MDTRDDSEVLRLPVDQPQPDKERWGSARIPGGAHNLRKGKEEEEKRNLPRCCSVRRREPVGCAATAMVSGGASVCGGGANGVAGTGKRGERGGKEEEKRMRRGEKICPAPPIYLRGGDRGCAIYCARSRKRQGVMAPRSWPRFPLRLNCRTIGHTVGHKEVTASCGTMDREEPEATRAARSDRNQVLARARSPRRPA